MKPYYDHKGITIYHGDCLEIIPELDPVDLVLTDPPYGIDMKCHKDDLMVSIQGINLSDAQKAICFMSPKRVFEFILGCKSWDFQRLLWWNKSADLSFPWRGWYMNSEAIVVLQRDNAKWPTSCKYHSDLYQSGPLRHKPPHPCWKPVDVLSNLLDHAAIGVTLDPFCGTGPTLRAAKELGRKAIGIEIEEKYCEIAARRLAQEVLPFRSNLLGK